MSSILLITEDPESCNYFILTSKNFLLIYCLAVLIVNIIYFEGVETNFPFTHEDIWNKVLESSFPLRNDFDWGFKLMTIKLQLLLLQLPTKI